MNNIFAITKAHVFVFNTPDQASVEDFMISVGYGNRDYHLDDESPAKTGNKLFSYVNVDTITRIFTVSHQPIQDTDTSYNGWKNQVTWLVNLWLTNSEQSNDYWLSEAKRVIKTKRELSASFRLSEELKDSFINHKLSGKASLECDLLNVALAWVDWREIADSLIMEIK